MLLSVVVAVVVAVGAAVVVGNCSIFQLFEKGFCQQHAELQLRNRTTEIIVLVSENVLKTVLQITNWLLHDSMAQE